MKKSRCYLYSSVILVIMFILLCALFFSACARVIRDVSDELVTNSWAGELKGGARVSLTFDEDSACLTMEKGEDSSSVEGLCILSADQFTIFDDRTGENFTFDYRLSGDRIELIFNNSSIILLKA